MKDGGKNERQRGKRKMVRKMKSGRSGRAGKMEDGGKTRNLRAQRVLVEGDGVGAATKVLLISNAHRQRLFVLEANDGVGRRRRLAAFRRLVCRAKTEKDMKT